MKLFNCKVTAIVLNIGKRFSAKSVQSYLSKNVQMDLTVTFLRDPNSKPQTTQTGYTVELNFLRENLDKLKKLTENNKLPLILDQRIYSKTSQFFVKSVKMNEDIYGMFTQYCDENYPHFRLQDLIAQSLLDFIEKY
ncbi:hypothetical protein IJ22_34010 [Paenibacillus naphthalenovorans]|uniref:Uncharacterized protein n=1 Tax=Paenibacillus naphthalenovorans TaxID=162209 RepID=A0A0U2L272_9BACL|nr:hypothetical protein IJ22_34010 [Paenibacillus naphthalenovorans]